MGKALFTVDYFPIAKPSIEIDQTALFILQITESAFFSFSLMLRVALFRVGYAALHFTINRKPYSQIFVQGGVLFIHESSRVFILDRLDGS